MNKPLRDCSWSRIVTYINSKDIGHLFKRKELLDNIKGVPTSTIDGYVARLADVGVLEKTARATHKLVHKIPEKMNTIILMQLQSDDRWKKWFMPVDERVERKHKKHYGS